MKKRNLLIALFASINALLVASIGLSLAWYVSGSILYIQQINISFRGDKKIYVGLDDNEENFKETIKFDDKNYFPISSMFSEEWIDRKASKPQFRGEYTAISHSNPNSYTKSDLVEEENGYFSKELYLYCESNVVLTVDSEQTTFTPDEEANERKARSLANENESKEDILKDLNDVVKSLRYSILIPNEEDYHYYIVDPYKEEDTYLCGLMNYDDNSNKYYDSYHEEEERYEYFYGEYNDESLIIYDEPLEEDTEQVGRPSKFNAVHQAGVHTVNMEDSLSNGFIPKVEESLSLDKADIKTEQGYENGVRIKLKAFIPTKIVLSLYLEGWDLDNTSYVEQGEFNANIKFRIGEEYF